MNNEDINNLKDLTDLIDRLDNGLASHPKEMTLSFDFDDSVYNRIVKDLDKLSKNIGFTHINSENLIYIDHDTTTFSYKGFFIILSIIQGNVFDRNEKKIITIDNWYENMVKKKQIMEKIRMKRKAKL